MRIRDLFEADDKRVLKLGSGMMTVPMGDEVVDDDMDEHEPITIRIGSKSKPSGATPAQNFMQAFEAVTHEHPFTRGMRYFEDGPVLVSMSTSMDLDDYVELRDIQSKSPGAGARAMETICRIADTHKVTLELFAMGYMDVPTDKLVSYYERFGFERLSNLSQEGVDMIRGPR